MAFTEVMGRWAEGQICAHYERQFGCRLPLHRPHSFREKLFARMVLLHRRRCRQYTLLSDKLAVRSYVCQTIGTQHLTTIAWAGRDPNAAPLERHREGGWIAKTNHGCGGHQPISEGDQLPLRMHLHQQLHQNYYWLALEAQYFHIQPHLYIERLVQGHRQPEPLNYRLWCFQGRVELIQVDDGSPFNPFYGPSWEPLELSYRHGIQPSYRCSTPPSLKLMVKLAEALAAPFGFVRVDMYNLAGRIVFGELTFTPLAGCLWLQPEAWDTVLGDWWPIEALV